MFTGLHFFLSYQTSQEFNRQHIGRKKDFSFLTKTSCSFWPLIFFGNPATLNYWGTWNYAEFCGYVGIALLFFAVYALAAIRTKGILFWFFIAFSALLFALPNPISTYIYKAHIPYLSTLQPTRLISIVGFAILVLSAYGIDRWLLKPARIPTVIATGVMLIGAGSLWAMTHVYTPGIKAEDLAVSQRNIILPTLLAAITLVIVWVRFIFTRTEVKNSVWIRIGFGIIIGAIVLFDLFRFGWKFTPFTDIALFFPETKTTTFLREQEKPFRITAIDDRAMPPNVNAYYGIESISGYDPLYDARYEEFIAAMERGHPDITPPFGFRRIITPKNITSPLMKLLNVRYILTLSELNDPRFRKVFQEHATRVYEDAEFLPRAFFVSEVVVEQSKQKMLDMLYAGTFDPRHTAIIEEDLSQPVNQQTNTDELTIISYEPDAMVLKTQLESERFLFLSNLFSDLMRVTIDGEEQKIYRTDYVFSGFIVPKGEHSIEITYGG